MLLDIDSIWLFLLPDLVQLLLEVLLLDELETESVSPILLLAILVSSLEVGGFKVSLLVLLDFS